MSLQRNITAATYTGNNSTQKFYGVGLVNKNPSYSIITIDGIRQLPGSDYVIEDDFGVMFSSPPGVDKKITIYALETSSSAVNISEYDNITTIQRSNYITDGTTKVYLIGNTTPKKNNCLVVVNGKLYELGSIFSIEANTPNYINFYSPLPRGLILQIISFTHTPAKIIGGVSQKDRTEIITTTNLIAEANKDVYVITGADSNKTTYCLAFVNGMLYEGGIDYIISHNRVKFIRQPAAGSQLSFVAFKADLNKKETYSRVRYLNKDNNVNERSLFNSWWREQISHYGTTVNYHVNLTTKQNADVIYGESPTAGYSEPAEINIIIKVDNESSMFSRFGLITDTDSTAYIHHDDFQEVFGLGSEPKAGDLLELIEIGNDRLNYPNRGPRIMEITDKLDEIPAEINNLAGHYIWCIKLKRFDYSREASMLPELGTKSAEDTGEIDPETNKSAIDELSKQIFDYDNNPCSNDSVYGDY
jgi:hypothetical protein